MDFVRAIYKKSTVDSDVLKSSFIYFCASLATFIEPINDRLGNVSYLTATAVLLFHPARSVGAMLESLICCIAGLGMGTLLTNGCLMLINYYYKTEKNIIEAHIIGLAALFLTTLLTSFVRAKFGTKRPSLNTATSLVHILLFVTITQMANENALEYLPYKLNRIVIALFSGTCLSCLGCYLIWPHTASSKLRKGVNKSFGILGNQIDTITDIITAPMASPTQFSTESTILLIDHEQSFDNLKKESVTLLAEIHKMKSQSLFEFWTTLFMHRGAFKRIIQSIERCFQLSCAVQHSLAHIEILPAHAQFVDLCSGVLTSCNNAVTALSYDVDILSNQSMEARENIIKAINAFEGHDNQIISEITNIKSHQIQNITHFTLSIIEFARELLCLIDLIRDLSTEISLRRRIGRTSWLLQKFRKLKDKKYQTIAQSLQNTYAKSFSVQCRIFFRQLRKFEFKFALKTAVTITLMAIPAFIEDYQDTFYEYRLHWAMTSAIVVLTPSVGGTNLQGIFRLLGTWVGAGTAVLIWIIGFRNPFILAPLCFFVSVPAFTFFLKSKYPKIGQISLLSFSVILLNKYAVAEDPVSGKSYSIYALARRRGAAVSLGVGVGLLVSWYIWPFQARHALRIGLSKTLLDISNFYEKLMAAIDAKKISEEDVLTLQVDQEWIYCCLNELSVFANQTKLEPRLRGPFPDKKYRAMINSATHIFDSLIVLQSVILHSKFNAGGDNDANESTSENKETLASIRKNLIGSVVLIFFTLSGALKLKSNVPEYLPDCEKIREEMMMCTRNSTHLVHVYYTYSAGADTIIKNLYRIHDEMRELV